MAQKCEFVMWVGNGFTDNRPCERTDWEEVEVAPGVGVRLCPEHRQWNPTRQRV